MCEWRPIETAPKDGTEVIVRCYIATVEFVHIAWYWGAEEWEDSGQFLDGFSSFEDWEGWWSYMRTSITKEKLEGYRLPTHWMPLPRSTNE